MGVPKKKTTRSRKKNRQSQQKLKPPTIALCPQCKAPKRAHFVCLECGYYKGAIVHQIGKKEKEKEK